MKCCPTKRAPDAGDSAHLQAVFYASAFFWLEGFAVPTPAQVTQTDSWLLGYSRGLLKKFELQL